MIGFGILFLIFGLSVILEGIAIKHGHKPNIVRGRYLYDKMTKEELNKLGKQIIAVGIGITLGSLSAFFFENDSYIPIIILVITITLSTTIYNIFIKK